MNRWIIFLIIVLLIAPLLIAQEDESEPALRLSVSGETCALALVEIEPEATPEATPEPETTPEAALPDWLPDLLTYTLGDNCDDLEPLLTVAANGRLWLALLTDDSEEWLPLDTLDDDLYPPQPDGRGRYFGCAIPDEGEQTCYVLVTLDEVEYLVVVPVWVGDAYFAPVPTATDKPEAQETPEQEINDNPPALHPTATLDWNDEGGQEGGDPPSQPTATPDWEDEGGQSG